MGCPPMQWQELQNRDRDLFTNVTKVNNVYLVGFNVIPLRAALAVCTTDGDDAEPTHDKLVERLDKSAMGGGGIRATLLTWHRRLGRVIHPSRLWVRCMGRSERGTLPV